MAHLLEGKRLTSGLPSVRRSALLIPIGRRPHVRSTALGKALAADKRQLVYGGGSKGIMGIVSSAVLGAGGDVVGVIPYAILAGGGETGDGSNSPPVKSEEIGRERVGVVRFRDPFITNSAPR